MGTISFEPDDITVTADEGELLSVVAARSGVSLRSDCGGQGVCRRCALVLEQGTVGDADGALLTAQSAADALEVLACQVTVQGDAVLRVPAQSRGADLAPFALTLGRAAELTAAAGAEGALARRLCVAVHPPAKGDSVADLDRLLDALRSMDPELRQLTTDLPTLRALPGVLRESGWHVCATVVDAPCERRLAGVAPAQVVGRPSFGLAVDIGTSTVAAALVNLQTGRVAASGGRRNAQVRYGDDVISRIVWTGDHENGLERMRQAVVQTLNEVTGELLARVDVEPQDVLAVTCAANSTMMNFLLGIDAAPIRRDPHTPPASRLPLLTAEQIGLDVWPHAAVFCLPTVSGFVGADITAGVLATGLAEAEELTVLVDVGTNGEIVLGMTGMLVCASCSAGPAFEGVGIDCGMHGAPGAIDEMAYDPDTDEVRIAVIGDIAPRGICGTGFIDALSTLFEAGIIDRAGQFAEEAPTSRIRTRDFEPEFVVVYEGEHGAERDLAIAQSDLENLIRSKAAVHAGLSVLLRKVGLNASQIGRLYLAGAFGSHLDVARAVTIGMLPDLPADRVEYVGNTSLAGAHLCLVSAEAREEISSIASAMTYVELSVEPGFMEEYVASMFLPHTDTQRFPSVVRDTTDA